MRKYYLTNLWQNEKGISVEEKAEITALQKQEIESWFSFVMFYDRCCSIKKMTIESGNDFMAFCESISKCTSYDPVEADKNHVTANKLLINYLSFLTMFYDVVANALSKQKGKDALHKFHEYDSKLYDTYVSYRLLKFCRNYVTHFDIPLTGLEFGASGIIVYAKVNELKRSEKWKKIQDDIPIQQERIEMQPHVAQCQKIIDLLYLNAIEFVFQDAYKGNQELFKICKQYGLLNPAIVSRDDGNPDNIDIANIPLRAFADYFEDINKSPKYNIHVNYSEITRP